MKVFIISGVSGAGKSVAIGALEDAGVHCVDNAPVELFESIVRTLSDRGKKSCALSVDVRNASGAESIASFVQRLSNDGFEVRGVFLDARDEELMRRFSETRRRHPLFGIYSDTGALCSAIARERVELEAIGKTLPSIDTSGFRPADLRFAVLNIFSMPPTPLLVTIESFGFKSGPPPISDFVFDARCLPNPHWVPELRSFDGRTSEIDAFLSAEPDACSFVDDLAALFSRSLPLFAKEGRPHVSISIGCTGGKHRSVWSSLRLFKILSEKWTVAVLHRNLSKDEELGQLRLPF